MKTFFFVLALFACAGSQSLNAQISKVTPFKASNDSIPIGNQEYVLKGKVIDEETTEPILFGIVVLYENGKLLTEVKTDFDGNYELRIPVQSPLENRIVDIEASYIGYNTHLITGFRLTNESVNNLNITLGTDAICIEPVYVTCVTVSIISPDDFTKGQTLTSYQIRQLATGRN